MDLAAIQQALRERQIDAWLFYDHHHRDPIAYKVLGLPDTLMVTRRWFYLIPASGEPRKINHRIEAGHLNSLPGARTEYSSWKELFAALEDVLKPFRRLAMEYSPNNLVPYVGLVDAGTIELLRSFGKEIVSSGDLVARFEAAWSEEQIQSHFAARDAVDKITAEAFQEIGRRVCNGGADEFAIQQWIMEAFARAKLVTIDPPIVAVNANSGNPHFEPTRERSAPMREGDWVLLDIWAKMDWPNAVYYDITWTGFIGRSPGARHREIFDIVTRARDIGCETAKKAVESGRKAAGWEVDQAVRDYITSKGYGQYFTHRTGHSIGSADVHGNGPNIDNLETKDERELIPNVAFSIEPGVYLPEFGVRSEVNVLVRNGTAEVTGRVQKEIVLI